MPVTNVSSKWVSGNLVFYDASGNIICTYDGTNRKVSFPSGSTLESLGTTTITDATLSPNDLALVQGSILVGDSAGKAVALSAKGDTKVLVGNATTLTSVALSGDVTMDNTGAVTIAGGAVESSMLASGAGVAALLTAGLGGSVSVTKTSAATDTVVAAHGTKDRACLVLVVVDETYAIGTGTLPTVKIGEDATVEKCMAGTVLDTEMAGTVLAFAFTNTATKKIIVTTTAAVGDATGGCSVTVLAIPTT